MGSLLGTILAQRGNRVQVFERRPDMRSAEISAGRSINLAMSDRGLQALEAAGIAGEVQKIAIPMYGRIIHAEDGSVQYQPYGKANQAINSVSRGELNKILISIAEQHGVSFAFNSRCVDVDVANTTATFQSDSHGGLQHVSSDVLVGADGAFSAVRARMQTTDRFEYSQSYLMHSYKELHIPALADGTFALVKNALHIWPRHSFMLIALPNLDGSFTCTLFLAHTGSPGFNELGTAEAVQAFFAKYFADAYPLMPTLVHDFFMNPESSLVTVKCMPWVLNQTFLIGDAAHAVVPFYGQGMNCGFEDCRVLADCLSAANGDWTKALHAYQEFRKPDADAIADLAVENFIEMRDSVADAEFLRCKKLEAFLHEHFPQKFIPQYSLVTFSPNVPYSEAQRIAAENAVFVKKLLEHEEISTDWTSDAARNILENIMAKRRVLEFKPISPLCS